MKIISDKLREECGLLGIYSPKVIDMKDLLYFGLMTLQHRGQEAAGICYHSEGKLKVIKGLGLIQDALKEDDFAKARTNLSIGHVRYSTMGEQTIENAQPLVTSFFSGTVGIAHNGNIINAPEIKRKLMSEKKIFNTTIDSEVVLHLIAANYENSMEEAMVSTLRELRGGFSLVMADETHIYAARDPFGFRPLCIGKKDDLVIVASETCALDVLGAEFIREVRRGELVIIGDDGIRSVIYDDTKPSLLCSFEYVYFSRPDSTLEGKSILEMRIESGELLAKGDKVDCDMVVPVPDSGISAALGYAKASGIPFMNVLIKNKYVGRTFIDPSQEIRERLLRLKLNVAKDFIQNKKILLVDDSIVRGTTMKEMIAMFKKSGAKEVHVRITSPPVTHPCYFGIDTPERRALVSANRTVEEVCQYIGADSLKFIDEKDLHISLQGGSGSYCSACFHGNYPMEVPNGKIKMD